jgi:hypothetical protein
MSGFLLFQELKIFLVVFQNKFDAELDISFSTFHGIIHIGEGDFRLNHPKFSNMPAGM